MLAIPVETTKKNITKAEKSARLQVEKKLQTGPLQKKPPDYLTDAQKTVYKWLYRQLQPTELMSSVDTKILCNACIIIERLERLDGDINRDPRLIVDKDYVNARDKYFRQYIVVCQQLGLSPVARAKFGTLAASKAKKKTDPLLAALGGIGND